MIEPRTPSKQDLAARLFAAEGGLVHMDPRPEDVFVPHRFKHLNWLALPVGMRRDLPTADLALGDEVLSCTLHFNGMKWPCSIPWRSVFGLSDPQGHGIIWPLDIPREARTADHPLENEQASPLTLTGYLIINGRAIVGKGSSVLVANGAQVLGVRWIDYSGFKVRIGGTIAELGSQLSKLFEQNERSLFLGYTAGRQDFEVTWADCRIQQQTNDVLEIRARSFYELRTGPGAGLRLYLREYIERVRRALSGGAPRRLSA
jgi:hypothetical protein